MGGTGSLTLSGSSRIVVDPSTADSAAAAVSLLGSAQTLSETAERIRSATDCRRG